MQRKRGELIERSFAHILETGGHRRVRLRGRANIKKRYLVHVAGFNLSLVLRKLLGFGTPRAFASARKGLFAALLLLWGAIRAVVTRATWQAHIRRTRVGTSNGVSCHMRWRDQCHLEPVSSTGS